VGVVDVSVVCREYLLILTMADNPSTLQQGNHPLSKKLKKILDTRLDNDKVG